MEEIELLYELCTSVVFSPFFIITPSVAFSYPVVAEAVLPRITLKEHSLNGYIKTV
jgi:hypothetical protein